MNDTINPALTSEVYLPWCESQHRAEVDLLKELAAIPAPSNHEELRAEHILAWLKGIGAEDAYVDPALNVVLPYPKGAADYSVFMAHTDVVFPDTTPLPVCEKDGKLYAPGIGDDTANVAALLTVIRYIFENKLEPKSPVLFVLNSGEEGLGNLKGVRQICESFRGKIKQLVSFDGCYNDIVNGAVGSERWKVTAKTIGGHSYGAFGNPNAISHMAKLICSLDAQPVPKKDGVRTTYNFGIINGGTSVNTIAQEASMLYEYRSNDIDHLAQMREQFFASFNTANCHDAEFSRELLGERPCASNLEAPAQQALLNQVSEVIRRLTGKEPGRHASSTDANIPMNLGIPATTFGLYIGEKAHTREENLEVASLDLGLKIGMTLILESCF